MATNEELERRIVALEEKMRRLEMVIDDPTRLGLSQPVVRVPQDVLVAFPAPPLVPLPSIPPRPTPNISPPQFWSSTSSDPLQ